MAETEDKKPEGETPEGTPAEGAGEESPQKSKLPLILAGVGILVAGGGGGAFWYIKHAKHGEDAAVEQKKKEAAAQKFDPKTVAYFDLPELFVNLRTSKGKVNFLKLNISLELKDKADEEKIKPFKTRIVDTFQLYLRELDVEDLKGSAGLFRMRTELLDRVNELVAPMDLKVNDVMYTNILVQ